MFANQPYDFKELVKTFSILILLVFGCMATQGGAVLIAIPCILAAYARRRPESQFFWMIFLVASICTNNYFIPKGMVYGISQRSALLMTGLLSIVQMLGSRVHKVAGVLSIVLVYIAYMILPSSVGWLPKVSYLKLLLFSLSFIAILGTASNLMNKRNLDIRKLRSIYLAFALFFIVGSLLLIPFPAISQLSGEEYEIAILSGKEVSSLFKGITVQSQVLGPVISLFGIVLLSDMLFGIQKFNRLYCILLLIVPYLIYLTSSRTAMGSFLLGACVMFFYFMRQRNANRSWKRKIISCSFLVVAAMVVVIALLPSMQLGIARYLLKYDDSASMSDVNWHDATRTRQGLMDKSLENFKKSPLIGNGFQVDQSLADRISSTEGFILSASIEKGVWVTAILEEGGAIGFALYLFTVLYIIAMLGRAKCYCGLSIYAIIHLINLGEFTIFAISGMGGLEWMMVFVALVVDEARNRSRAYQIWQHRTNF